MPLEVLTRGLKVIQDRVSSKKDELEKSLAGGGSITLEEEDWLDNGANLVQETQLVFFLADAPNFGSAVKTLTNEQKEIMARLTEAARAGKDSSEEECPETEPERNEQNIGRSKPVSGDKENATPKQRVEILTWHHENGNNRATTVQHFDKVYPRLELKEYLLWCWLRDEEVWRKKFAIAPDSKRVRLDQPRLQQTSEDEISRATILISLEDGDNDVEPSGSDRNTRAEDEAQGETAGDVEETPPTPLEVLRAVLLIQRHLKQWDDPIVPTLDGILNIYLRQIRDEI